MRSMMIEHAFVLGPRASLFFSNSTTDFSPKFDHPARHHDENRCENAGAVMLATTYGGLIPDPLPENVR